MWERGGKREREGVVPKKFDFLEGGGTVTKLLTKTQKDSHIDSYTSDKTVLNLN